MIASDATLATAYSNTVVATVVFYPMVVAIGAPDFDIVTMKLLVANGSNLNILLKRYGDTVYPYHSYVMYSLYWKKVIII